MKTRIMSAFIAFLIFIPIFVKGGTIFELAIYALAILGLHEFIHVMDSKKELPTPIRFISYIAITLMILSGIQQNEFHLTIDFRLIAGLFATMLIPTVLYHDEKKYNIRDAFYMIGGIFFLGSSLTLLVLLRQMDLMLVIFLFMITILTDTFAYFGGYLIGNNKLIPSVSPKKTWEGLIVGTVFAVFSSSVFYLTVIDPNCNWLLVVVVTTFLSLLGQFGDLVFSAIKRHFGKKDFSNIMPGHGGILDRLDSIIFVLLGFTFFMSIL